MAVRYDADATPSSEQRELKRYKDLNLSLTKNSITNDIVPLTSSQSIKRSISHLIHFKSGDKPFHPEVGSQIESILFEPIDGITATILVRLIELTINNFEPRVILAGVRVLPLAEENRYDVVIDYYIKNAPADLESVEIILERVR